MLLRTVAILHNGGQTLAVRGVDDGDDGLCHTHRIPQTSPVYTDLRVNASEHKAMSYARMVQAEAELAHEVEQRLGRAEQEDAVDDAAHGERRGDETPDWMQSKQARLARIRAARAELEAEAKAVHTAKQEDKSTPPTRMACWRS